MEPLAILSLIFLRSCLTRLGMDEGLTFFTGLPGMLLTSLMPQTSNIIIQPYYMSRQKDMACYDSMVDQFPLNFNFIAPA